MEHRLWTRTASLASLVLSLAGVAGAQELASNQYRVYTADSKPPEWSGELWTYDAYGRNRDNIPQRGGTKGSQTLIQWGTYGPDSEGNTPVKYILMFVKEDCYSSYRPWNTAESTKAWFELKGENQAPYIIECGADIHQMVDPNTDGGWQQIFLVIEFSNGARSPAFGHLDGGKWQGDGVDTSRFDPAKDAGKLREPLVIRTPKGYGWEAGTYTLGDAPAETATEAAPAEDDGSLKPGHYRVLVRGKAPEWTGEAWGFDGSGVKFGSRDSRTSDKQILLSWPEAADKDDGAKVTSYLLVFTGPPAGSHNPFWVGENTRKIFGLRAENQASFLVEVAPDVHMLHDTHGSGAWDRMYVVVCYSDGSRGPFTATDGCVEYSKDKVQGPCVRTPNGYWKENGTFKCEE